MTKVNKVPKGSEVANKNNKQADHLIQSSRDKMPLTESNEEWHTNFELKNDNGLAIANVSLDYDDEIIIGSDDIPYKRLRSLTLASPTTGAALNLFDLFSFDAEEIQVRVSAKRLNKASSYRKGVMTLNFGIENPLDILTFLHEGTHVEQKRDEMLGDLGVLYAAASMGFSNQNLDTLKKMSNALPRVMEILKADKSVAPIIAELEVIEPELNTLLDKGLERFSKESGEKPKASDEHRKARIEEIRNRRKELWRGVENANDIGRIPYYYLEWDANRGAFEKAKEIQGQIGVDVMTSYKDGNNTLDAAEEIKRIVLSYFGPGINKYPENVDEVIQTYRLRQSM